MPIEDELMMFSLKIKLLVSSTRRRARPRKSNSKHTETNVQRTEDHEEPRYSKRSDGYSELAVNAELSLTQSRSPNGAYSGTRHEASSGNVQSPVRAEVADWKHQLRGLTISIGRRLSDEGTDSVLWLNLAMTSYHWFTLSPAPTCGKIRATKLEALGPLVRGSLVGTRRRY